MAAAESPRPFDRERAKAFTERAVGDLSAALTLLLAALGDRLGLFASLAEGGPATSEELAARTATDERYVREWLLGMAAAGYLDRDEQSGRYELPPEHAAVLATEGSPVFMCGGYQMVPGLIDVFDGVEGAFREGGGVRQSSYRPLFWQAMERFGAGWVDNLLVDRWLPQLPHVTETLERGAKLADVGCGAGHAAIRLAQAFPASEVVGFDVHDAQIDRARAAAEAAGIGDRVRFELLDGSSGIPGTYDIVTTFDVIHDAVDPDGLLRAIRAAVADGGSYLMLEINCADRAEDNVGPLAAMHFGFSVFYCLTTSLANGGAGLGTCGMPEQRVRELCIEAGFSAVRRVEIDNPFNALYEVV